VRQLDRLLLLEVGRAVNGERRAIAEASQPEQLTAEQPAPAAERLGAAVLDDEIGISRQALDGDVANHFAGCSSRRTKRQAHGVAGQVARQQKIALGLVAVE